MIGWWKKQKIMKEIEKLTPEKKQRLKEFLKTHCIHGVPLDRAVPCLECMKSDNIADVIRFL